MPTPCICCVLPAQRLSCFLEYLSIWGRSGVSSFFQGCQATSFPVGHFLICKRSACIPQRTWSWVLRALPSGLGWDIHLPLTAWERTCLLWRTPHRDLAIAMIRATANPGLSFPIAFRDFEIG